MGPSLLSCYLWKGLMKFGMQLNLGGKQLLAGVGNPISISNLKGSYYITITSKNQIYSEQIIKH